MAGKAAELHTLLCQEGRKLVNLKFFPGSKAKDADDVLNGACEMFSRALKGEGEGLIPKTNKKPVHFSDLVTNK